MNITVFYFICYSFTFKKINIVTLWNIYIKKFLVHSYLVSLRMIEFMKTIPGLCSFISLSTSWRHLSAKNILGGTPKENMCSDLHDVKWNCLVQKMKNVTQRRDQQTYMYMGISDKWLVRFRLLKKKNSILFQYL